LFGKFPNITHHNK